MVALGTTGESPTLSSEEKREVCAAVARFNRGRLPWVMGRGGNDTASLLKQIGKTDFSGYSYILSVAPYYNKPGQRGLYAHFKAVAEASPVPVIVYNIPSRCGANIEPETIVKLAESVPNIAAVFAFGGDGSRRGHQHGGEPAAQGDVPNREGREGREAGDGATAALPDFGNIEAFLRARKSSGNQSRTAYPGSLRECLASAVSAGDTQLVWTDGSRIGKIVLETVWQRAIFPLFSRGNTIAKRLLFFIRCAGTSCALRQPFLTHRFPL